MKKIDSDRIERHIDFLKSETWMYSRKWWPNFVYHTTSLANAVNILTKDVIYSRNKAIQTSSLQNDIADAVVIGNTVNQWKDHVRFYLRPKTPTLYINEGVKPLSRITNNAHCAVPVCFLFDAKSILTRDDCQFSDGNLGSPSVAIGNNADFFTNLPFNKIYHVGSFSPSETSIIYHRNAEAIIPNQVDLSTLKYISCRSEAEKETLIHLLSHTPYQKWINKIGVSSSYSSFNEEWNFVREVKVNRANSTLVVKFNEQTKNPRGPFAFKWGFELAWEDGKVEREEDGYTLTNDFKIDLKSYAKKSFTFWISLDGHLIYKNNFYSESDFPF